MIGGLVLALTCVQVPTFESRIETVYVDVLATADGTILENLDAAHFEVRDNGVPQRVSLVSRESTSLHAVLALDVSGSVAGPRLADLKAAARSFIAGLAPADRVTVLAFNHGQRLVAGPGTLPEAAAPALDALEARGSTALQDAALAGLVMADSSLGRPVLLIFSDGENRLSWTTPERAIDATRFSEAVVYGVGAGTLESRGRRFLDGLAAASGGRVWQARAGDELQRAFAQILLELRGRRLLRYEPVGSDKPGWHTLEVKLKGVRGVVRARPGYFRR